MPKCRSADVPSGAGGAKLAASRRIGSDGVVEKASFTEEIDGLVTMRSVAWRTNTPDLGREREVEAGETAFFHCHHYKLPIILDEVAC